jgi:hypothetical protein
LSTLSTLSFRSTRMAGLGRTLDTTIGVCRLWPRLITLTGVRTRQHPISCHVTVQVCGLHSIRKKSTPYSHHKLGGKKKKKTHNSFVDRCHWKKLRCTRQGAEQRSSKGTFLLHQAYFKLPFVRWHT